MEPIRLYIIFIDFLAVTFLNKYIDGEKKQYNNKTNQMYQNVNVCIAYKWLSVLSGLFSTVDYQNLTQKELYKNMSQISLQSAYKCRTKNNHDKDNHLEFLWLKYKCQVIHQIYSC